MSRYVNIATRIWHDEKFRELPDDAKVLFIYLLTSPHGNMCGLFYLPPLYACHDLKWTERRYRAAIEQLKGRVCIDGDIILIKNFLRYNPIKGPKQAIGAANRLKEVPDTPLIGYFLKILEQNTDPNDYEKFIDTYGIPHQYPIDTPPIPDTDTDTDTETETESDTETESERKPPKQSKVKYADYVKMTPDEHQKLIDQFGQAATSRMIEILDNYKGASGKTYKSDYRAILNWVVKRWREEHGQPIHGSSQISRQDNDIRFKYE